MSTASGHTAPRSNHSNSSNSSSPSSSISLVRLDELSSFGATKQNRLPALIKLNPLVDSQQQQQQQLQSQQQVSTSAATSLPNFSASEVEKMVVTASAQAESLPVQQALGGANKENTNIAASLQQQLPDANLEKRATLNESDDFQVVEMEDEEAANVAATRSGSNNDLIGPSLPAQSAPDGPGETTPASANFASTSFAGEWDAKSLSAQLQSSHLGDSLIEMIINLRNENQNLVRALETNNDYVKERLQEFKRCQEEAKRRESQHALEKAEFEHQARKLRRQNEVLSERLKSLEGKLKELNAEVGESLEAAHSSKASSVRDANDELLYPQLPGSTHDSFSNAALASAERQQQHQQQHQQPTMQMDATSGELYNQGHAHSNSSPSSSSSGKEEDEMEGVEQAKRGVPRAAAAAPAATNEAEARRVGDMSKEELSKHFDANKSQFYALEDPMKQCDQLEKQLNDIGRRDYEICLLQQQLNIYRQDFRLERMAKLEARIQIEKLKSDIDRLCLERVQEDQRERGQQHAIRFGPSTSDAPASQLAGGAVNMIGKLGHHLSKKAVRSAAKAAKYAAKQAHLEEKAAAALARAQAARATAAQFQHNSHNTVPKSAGSSETGAQQTQPTGSQEAPAEQLNHQYQSNHHHRGHHRHSSTGGGGRRSSRPSGIRSEVVNDLLSTANKAMLTGYKMASTHVNLALDKLSQFEQQQAAQLDPNNKTPIQQQQQQQQQQRPASNKSGTAPSAPPMDPPSID